MRMEDQARIIDKLMVGLGFGDGYVAQGGDIGSFVSRTLVVFYEGCKAAHRKTLFSISSRFFVVTCSPCVVQDAKKPYTHTY